MFREKVPLKLKTGEVAIELQSATRLKITVRNAHRHYQRPYRAYESSRRVAFPPKSLNSADEYDGREFL